MIPVLLLFCRSLIVLLPFFAELGFPPFAELDTRSDAQRVLGDKCVHPFLFFIVSFLASPFVE